MYLVKKTKQFTGDFYMEEKISELKKALDSADAVIIGAGSIVTHDIPDNSVAVGVPARVIKTADEYLEKLKKESLHLGHLKGEEKDRALKKHFNYEGTSKGIYF